MPACRDPLSPDGGTLYVADTGHHAVRRVDLQSEQVTTIAGNGRQAVSEPGDGAAAGIRLSSPWDLALHGDLLFIASTGTHQIWSIDLRRRTVTVFAGSGAERIAYSQRKRATLAQPQGLAVCGG